MLNLKEYLAQIDKVGISSLQEGSAHTVEEFFNNCVIKSLPKKETVLKWHKILKDYVQEKDAVFFLRMYGSVSKKDKEKNRWNNLRRGFLTEYSNGTSYVFCDNFFAHYFYVMAIDDYVPDSDSDYDDFYQTMKNREFPHGYRYTKEEKVLQAYYSGKQPQINNAGWELAHLIPVNKDYSDDSDYSKKVQTLFPRGEREEWRNHHIEYKSRFINREIGEELDILKSHFLRLVHPINFFLVPLNTNINIGELSEMINYIYYWNAQEYKDIFNEYLDLIQCDDSKYKLEQEACGKKIIDIKYSKSPKKQKSYGQANEDKIQNEIDKVKRRVPIWFNNPDQKNSTILIAFLRLLGENSNPVSKQAIKNKCNFETFESNFIDMSNTSDRGHGKVFEVTGDEVTLWEPVAQFILQEWNKHPELY
jgi:hypothetical protein